VHPRPCLSKDEGVNYTLKGVNLDPKLFPMIKMVARRQEALWLQPKNPYF
jgi:hypothetical protein